MVEQEAVLRLVSGLMRGSVTDQELATKLGWKVEETDSYVELRPTNLAVDYMVFRKGEAAPYIVQIPHARTEFHLARIAPEIYTRLNARALWMTTAVKRSVLDSAHDYLCDMSVATIAAARTDVGLTVISLHGFVASELNRLFKTDVIVSSGSVWPTAKAITLFKELKKHFRGKERILLFPWETYSLGGTTNSQGQLLRSQGLNEAFLHLELSLSFREAMKEDQRVLERFTESLAKGLQQPLDKEALAMSDPWSVSVGAHLRRTLGGTDMLRIALDVSKEEFEADWKPNPARIAERLGLSETEVTHYLGL